MAHDDDSALRAVAGPVAGARAGGVSRRRHPALAGERVRDLMSQPVITIDVDETLWDACQLLFVSGLRHLVVLDDGVVTGVLADRTVLSDLPLSPEHLGARLVGEVMPRRDIVSARPAWTTPQAAQVMADHGLDALPVIDDEGRLVGILTSTDMLEWIAGHLGYAHPTDSPGGQAS